MPNYQQQNDRRIKAAFDRFAKRKDAIIEDGMRRLMKDAMEYALDLHDYEHHAHRTHEDSYGWAVLHDGQIKHLQVNGGRHGHGLAEAQIRDVATRAKQTGWVGILLASMVLEYEKRKPTFFEVDYEMGILNATADEIGDFFKEYFKPIS